MTYYDTGIEAQAMQQRPTFLRRLIAIGTLVLAGATPRSGTALTIATQDGLSLSLGTNADVSSLLVDGADLVGSSAAAIALRDLSAAASVDLPDLLYNGSFEDDDGVGGADGWALYFSPNSDPRFVTDVARDGLRSLFAETDPSNNANGEAAYVSAQVPVTAGSRYRLSAFFLARDGYVSAKLTAPAWQLDAYSDPLTNGLKAGGIYVSWYDNPDGSGDPLDTTLVAPMHSNASVWKRISGEVEAPGYASSARVVVALELRDSKRENDAVWVDDVSMIASPEVDRDVTATVSRNGNQLLLTGTVAGTGLDVETTYTALADRIEISGRVTDLTASDRALELVVRFPLDLTGFDWWDDIRNSRTVAAGEAYSNHVSSLAGARLLQSLYPVAVLEDGARAIALAFPLDSPRVVLLRYADGFLQARFQLGLSPAATRLNGEATFSIYLFRSDADWGFRAAWEKFQSFKPDWFRTQRSVYALDAYAQGHFLSEGGCLPNCDAPCEQCCSGAHLVACYDDAGTGAVEYVAPEGPMSVGKVVDPPPSYAEILAQLNNPAQGEEDRYLALAASLVLDGNGDYVLKHVVNPNWAPEDWEANWVLNMDPDLASGYGEWSRVARVDDAFVTTQAVGAGLEGMQLDNLMSAPAVDLDTSHFAVADHSLTYDPNTYRPGIHTMSSTFEYMQWMREYLETNYTGYPGPGLVPGMSANIWGIGTLNFLTPLLDGLGNETRGEGAENWTEALIAYRRSISYHKPLGSPWQRPDVTLDEAHEFADINLFYGTNTIQAKHGVNWAAGASDILDQSNARLRRFWQLGWEPVTRASTESTELWVERFGSAFSVITDSVYFSVYNPGSAALAYDLIVDTAALGLADPSEVVVKDARTALTLPYSAGAGTITVAGFLEAKRTDLIRLMAPGCLPTELRSASLTFKPDVSDDRLRIKGSFDAISPEPEFTTEDVIFLLTDHDGEIFRATVPAGGFGVSTNGRTFRFKDKTGLLANGLISAKFKRRGDGRYKWSAKAKNVDLTGADRLYVDLGIEMVSTCWADSRDCASRSKGKKLRCRP
ncbi:MAG: hypothetical protein ACE5E4_06280 [Candidatus Binatia bacterium]